MAWTCLMYNYGILGYDMTGATSGTGTAILFDGHKFTSFLYSVL